MTEFLKQRRRVEGVDYVRYFEDFSGMGGYSFPCDKDGNIFDKDLLTGEPMSPIAKANYEKCLRGELNTIDKGVRAIPWYNWENAVIRCVRCGAEVELYDAFLSTCPNRKCNADYNASGQLLAPRQQWGEETGENLTDMLNMEPWWPYE